MTRINNYIIVNIVIITIILIKKVIIMYLKKEKKDFSPTFRKSLWSGLGLNLGLRVSYLSNYLTRPNDLGYSDYFCMPIFLIAYNRRVDYKLFLTFFYHILLLQLLTRRLYSNSNYTLIIIIYNYNNINSKWKIQYRYYSNRMKLRL